jgi:hypothetical protein
MGRVQPIGSPELKSKIAANTGPMVKILAQRVGGCGEAGGESVLYFKARRASESINTTLYISG